MLSGSKKESATTFLPFFQIHMETEFKVERDKERDTPQNYLTPQQREQYHVDITNGIFYQNGERMHGEYLYTLMPNNSLYAARPSEVRFHSWLTAGADVEAAGMLYLNNGKLITISNESGHYKPKRNEMMPVLAWFAKKIRTYNFIFEDHSDQMKGRVFNGINYSLIRCWQLFHEMVSIDLTDLLHTSLPLIVSANEICKAKEEIREVSEDLGKDYYISNYDITVPKEGSLEHKILDSQFSYFSCLKKFLDDTVKVKSRYLGHLRAK